MKKLVVTTIIAIIALLKLPTSSFAWGDDDGFGGDFGSGLPSGLTSVRIDLSVLGQGGTNTTTNGITIVHFKQSRLDNNDILGLINNEFGTSFSGTNGDHLAVSNFWDGRFIVLGRTNNILLANASSNTNGDHYELGLLAAHTVFAATETTNCETQFSVTDGSLIYKSGNGSNSFTLEGFTTVNDAYFNDFSNSAESFQLSGGIGSISSSSSNGLSGVLTGTVSGSGKNNAPPL